MMAYQHFQSGLKTNVLRGRGWRALRGLGQRGAVPGGALPTTTTTTTTGTTLPARGASYQTVVPTRTGAGLATQVPAGGRTGTVNYSLATTTYNSTVTPNCPALTYWNSVTGKCSATTSGASAASAGSTATSYLPWILGAGVVLVLIFMSQK